MDVVVKSLEETFSEVHVTNGVDGILEDYRSGSLPVSVAPVVLNAFQVPLVDNSHDLLAFAVVDVGEQVFVSLVNEDFLKAREENIQALNVPVSKMLVEAFLSESFGSSLCDLLSV